MYQHLRPTWAEINLDNIAHNVQAIKQRLQPGCEIMAVVKADAYGHGAPQVARTALEAGATRLAVSILDEACELRGAGLSAPILVMGYTPAAQGGLAASQDISLTVYERQQALALVQAAQAAGFPLKVHLKVDTGMGRLGVQPDEAAALASWLHGLAGCQLEGIFTHLAKADAADPSPTYLQLQRFELALAQLQQAGVSVPLVHAANSAAAMRFPSSQFSAVRLGLALYGLYPNAQLRGQDFDLRPAMTLNTTIAQAKWLPANSPVSYGGRFVTRRPSYIITLPFGYADGCSRALSGKGSVLVSGHKVPLIGAICMDQCMADATEVPEAQVGDPVVIWGENQGQSITVDDIAASLDTISYEVVTLVSKRVPRVYFRHGQVSELRTLLQHTTAIAGENCRVTF